MPRMDGDANESDSLVKLLLIGDGKVGKTHYAGMAAMAGFNVLYFDGDIGRPTLKTLPLAARQRIYALDCADTLGGGEKDSRFLETMLEFVGSRVFKWNDSRSKLSTRGGDKPGDEIYSIRPASLDASTVFVLDSWTGLTESMMTSAAMAHSVNLLDTKPTEMRGVYQSAGMKATQILQCIRSLRCHVIVIAHPDEYSHMTKPEGKKMSEAQKEGNLTIDWTKMVPRSVSKPHGFTMAKYFTDVAWAETNASGTERLLDFRMKQDRLSGGHFNDRKNVDDFSFANLVRLLGGRIPDGSQSIESWLTIHTVEEAVAGEVSKSILQGGQQAQPVGLKAAGGMAALMKKA